MSDEKQATDAFEETMAEFDTAGETTDVVDMRGDAGFSSKEEFGKKTVYIPCQEHRARQLFTKALEERSGKSDDVAECNLSIQLTIVYPAISKKVVAHIVKANRLLKQLSGYDYVVEFSGCAFDKLTDEEIMRVYHHELEHLGFREDRKGNLKHGIVDHDLLDFHSIIDKYGLHWLPSGILED